MRLRTLLACLLLATVTFASPVTLAQEDALAVRIREILPAPDAGLGQREFIELHNTGSGAVDLTGWVLRDAPTASNNTNSFTFPAFVLDAGRRVVVWSNGTPDGSGFAWSQSAAKTVWNDAGDAASLLDAQGVLQDWLGYGSTTQAAPAGFDPAKPAAPPKGKSLQWVDGAWQALDPTPGLGVGEVGGTITATVANVAPTLRLEVPVGVRPSQAFAVQAAVGDGNGASDIVAWTLRAGGVVVHQGNGSLDGPLVVTAPAAAGNWTLVLTARDAAGANASLQRSIAVVRPLVSVLMPAEGLVRFLEMQPGQRNATTQQAFTLRNEGAVASAPLIDISPLRSGRHVIPVDGNLWLGLDDGAGTTWTRYDGPLQAMPTIEPGEQVSVLLRIAQVPTPAAAGVYGTAFTVVAA